MEKEIKKYKILVDYGAHEGMQFWDEAGYDTVDEAVKRAIGLNICQPFLIVQVIDWKAQENPLTK